jgi:hypothetical protein
VLTVIERTTGAISDDGVGRQAVVPARMSKLSAAARTEEHIDREKCNLEAERWVGHLAERWVGHLKVAPTYC